jgi:hypothetical protein
MRALAFEKLLILIEQAVEAGDIPALQQYATKSKILRSRSNDQAVIKELINQ